MKRLTALLLCALLVMRMLMPASAADLVWRLTHNNQDALLIGRITAVYDHSFILEPTACVTSTIPPRKYPWDGIPVGPLEIQGWERGSALVPGMQALVSLAWDEERSTLSVCWGVFRLVGSAPEQMKVYQGDWREYKSLTAFLNTATAFDGTNLDEIAALLEPEDHGDVRAIIYPAELAHLLPQPPPPPTDLRWLYAAAALYTAGVLLAGWRASRRARQL